MKFEYYSDTDTLYISLRDEPGTDAREVAPDIVLDVSDSGDVVGIEIERASTRTDLSEVKLSHLPVRELV
ncbi:MAG: DUF2283 domain-containing protein [Rhodothermales bacterium]|nr:DUF2283 domain-containing protein [Rhodothermales bacterium]